MSLVDYASSSDEEDSRNTIATIEVGEEPEPKVLEQVAPEKRQPTEASIDKFSAPKSLRQVPQNPPNHDQRSTASVNQQGKEIEPPVLKLPDAASLFSSPALPSNVANATDHSSRVAVAMAESASRKRDLNISSSSSIYTRHKLPKGNLPYSKKVPDTVGGNLLPPQLAGRSNVVTEDISKLFVKKCIDSSST